MKALCREHQWFSLGLSFQLCQMEVRSLLLCQRRGALPGIRWDDTQERKAGEGLECRLRELGPVLVWPRQAGVQNIVGTQKSVAEHYKLTCDMYLCLQHCPKSFLGMYFDIYKNAGTVVVPL